MDLVKRVFKNKKRLIALIIILIAVIGIWRYRAINSESKVETSKVERGIVAQELVLSGEVEAVEYARLSFQGSGELSWVGVHEGEEVKKGQALARLDTVSLNQQLQVADADFRYYQSVLDRVYDQLKGHETNESYSQKETRTQAESAKDKAYRAYQIAKHNLSNSTLKSPFNGIVASISHPYAGVNTSLTESQIEVINPETLYFNVSADQTEVNQITIGQEVEILLDSFADNQPKGKVSYVGITPKIGETGSVYEVKINFDQGGIDNSTVRVGMTGDAKFILSKKDDVLYAIPQFVNTDTTGKYLKIGKPSNKTYIETGLEGEERIEIKSDSVKEGDTLYD